MRRIERDERRIAVAPVGDRLEQRAVGRLVGFLHDEIGMRAARIGEAHAEPDAAPLGERVDRDDAQRALDLGHDGKRLSLRRRGGSPLRSRSAPPRQPRTDEAVGAKPRQAKAQDPRAPSPLSVRQSVAHAHSTPA